MNKLEIKFERKEIRNKTTKDYETVSYSQIETLEEHINKTKEEKKMPYPIASNRFFELWKFFMSYDSDKKKMDFLDSPRYMIRKGQQWFKVYKITVL